MVLSGNAIVNQQQQEEDHLCLLPQGNNYIFPVCVLLKVHLFIWESLLYSHTRDHLLHVLWHQVLSFLCLSTLRLETTLIFTRHEKDSMIITRVKRPNDRAVNITIDIRQWESWVKAVYPSLYLQRIRVTVSRCPVIKGQRQCVCQTKESL